ncbi:hypothetical protein ABL78_1360 [Leptomonas seymouri]|uniref:Protein HGH1 homolog n=1 Tax=Leptomonas seymouri TaxID=5684 RepID=A0A0N1IMC4_LEPSE|nr:hypothetical protein ABL78_1360 [Leptomonas seymouri]|eukprot:KPI89484.1 hypothetical protein ABL78_1360 [Leptomonas seymouri]
MTSVPSTVASAPVEATAGAAGTSSSASPAVPLPSTETIHHFQEAFSFVSHEREDVRKMAIHGIAEQSKGNHDLWHFLASPQYGPRCIDALLQYLHAGGKNVLGDILTIFVNCSADGSCAEMLVQRKLVRKAMRLLDGMERSDQSETYVRGVQEMTLMLLNNLTASHVTAIDDLLQKDDEDLRGFYLGKLHTYHERFRAEEEEVRRKVEEAEEAKKEVSAAGRADAEGQREREEKIAVGAAAAAAHRDLNRWILHILLNLTRTLDGQEMLLEDEEWQVTLSDSLASPNPRHRYLAVQCYRNCACSPKPLYNLILKSDALVTAVHRLALKEPIADIQLSLAEFIASMLESEDGMARLESVNAKKALASAVAASKLATDGRNKSNSRVEVVEEDGVPVEAPAPSIVLGLQACELIERSVLPYLDDVVDAYLAPGSDELD